MASIAEMMVAQGLENSAKPGVDLGQAVTRGAQLAESIEGMQRNRELLNQQKEQLQLAKIDKLTSIMETGAKIKSKSARNAFFKNYVPKAQAAMGLQDFIPKDTLAMIQADPEQAKKFSLLKTKIYNGDMTYDQAVAAMDPEQWAMLDDAEVMQLEAAEKFRVQQSNTTERAQTMAGRREGVQETRDFTNLAQELGNRVRAEFKPIQERKASLRLANSGLEKVLKDIRAGKNQNSIDFSTAARGLAKAFNSGAMTDDDVNDFKRNSGLSNITEDGIRKYLIGGANAGAVQSLLGVAKRSAATLDQQANELAASFAPQFETPQFAGQADTLRRTSGIDAFLKPTLEARKQEGEALNISGRQVLVNDLKNAYKSAKNQAKFIADMAMASGKTEAEVKKILGAK